MQNTHIHQTIRTLEQELESHHQSCHEIERALVPLRRLAGDGHAPSESPRRRASHQKPRRAVTQPTAQATHARAARSLPDDADAILATLRKHGGPMKPRELADKLGIKKLVTLRYRLKPLVQAKQVELSGATMNRSIRLLPPRAAKEAP